MFDNLSDRLGQTIQKLRGRGRLSEKNISDSVREVRRSLLEADVALAVVQKFITRVKERAVGAEVAASLSPGQAFIKIVHDELTALMGERNEVLNLNAAPPAVVILAGLQGAGKTTTAAKLANYLITREKKTVAMVSADIYRPAAIEQLKILAAQVGADYIASSPGQTPVAISKNALNTARKNFTDILIIDTAGRLHIDDIMMEEIKAVHKTVGPVETLFVVDGMTGQDAANTAQAFNRALPLSGVILTKVDGDARGGAALSVREITGKPVKFIGIGEKVDELEAFHPERIASRILGMGDVLSLIEEAERKVDRKKAQRMARKIKKGVRFNFNDFKSQIVQMRDMGGMSSLIDKLPGTGQIPQAVKNKMNDRELVRMEAMINSMTRKERLNPDLIRGSRKKRICRGSGTNIQELNRLLKQYKQVQAVMKKMKGGNMKKIMRGIPGFG